MKNIQVIDAALNCVYDLFAATDEEFSLIFPPGQDIAFIDEVRATGSRQELDNAFNNIWRRRVPKINVNGIHGLLFYDSEHKKESLASPCNTGTSYPEVTGTPPWRR